MGTRRWMAGAIAGVLALAGCGGSSHKAAATASSTASSTAPPAPSATFPPPGASPGVRLLAGRVLRAGDLAGFAPQGWGALGSNASSWVAEEHLPATRQTSEAARLRRLGFVTGVLELLAPASGGPAEAISIAVRFRSPRAAREDLASEVRMGESHGAAPFAAAGIPAAKGFGGSSGGTTGYNVAFADGDYYYLVGSGYPTGTANAPKSADVIHAAQRLYGRVHR